MNKMAIDMQELEENKRQERYENIKQIYIMILKHGWYISNFHDKFHSGNHFCFVMRNEDCTKRDIIRLPL